MYRRRNNAVNADDDAVGIYSADLQDGKSVIRIYPRLQSPAAIGLGAALHLDRITHGKPAGARSAAGTPRRNCRIQPALQPYALPVVDGKGKVVCLSLLFVRIGKRKQIFSHVLRDIRAVYLHGDGNPPRTFLDGGSPVCAHIRPLFQGGYCSSAGAV